jgi:hypothetical protein
MPRRRIQRSTGRDMMWSPTIRAALIAGTPWLDVFCPGCGTSRAIDLRTVDRHPLASVGTLARPAAFLVSGLGADAEAIAASSWLGTAKRTAIAATGRVAV